MSYTCERHNLPDLNSYCPSCVTEYDNARPASEMTPAERAQALRDFHTQVTVPFDRMHARIEELVGRPVWTHEMGTAGFQRLIEETKSGNPDVRNMIKNLPSNSGFLLPS